MKTIFLPSPTLSNISNEAFLDNSLPQELLGIIFDQVVNQRSQPLHDICSILLTCKNWKNVLEKNPCISLVQALFQLKDSHPSTITFPQECITTEGQKQHFTSQEIKLIDQAIDDQTFKKLLVADSKLFHPKSLFLSLLDRYSWDPEFCKKSANPNIQHVAEEQLSILKSLISGTDEQRFAVIKNDSIKKLYYGNHALAREEAERSVISTLKKFPNFNDKQIFIQVARHFARSVFNIHESLKKDCEIVLAAVQQDGYAFFYADASLKKDREIILAAVKQNGYFLQYADENFKKDREIVLTAVQKNGLALEYADESLKKDKEIVLTAVQKNGLPLKYADESLKKDREIVLTAVQKDGRALQYADESLKKDREIVLTAVKENIYALVSADKTLKKDREIIFTAFAHKHFVQS